LVQKFGEDWIKVGEELDGMDPIKIRNRYFSRVKKNKKHLEEIIKGSGSAK